jgi:hypothetical protein
MKSEDIKDILKDIQPGARLQLKMEPGGKPDHFITEDARRGIDELVHFFAFGGLTAENPETMKILEETTQHGLWDDPSSRIFVVVTTNKFDLGRFITRVGPHLESVRII